MDYVDFTFKLLSDVIGSFDRDALALAISIINILREYHVLPIMFAIQFSVITVNFVLTHDGFEYVVSFIRMIVVYMIILLVLSRWDAIGFGFLRFVNGVMTGAVASAAGTLSGDPGLNISGTSNPAEVIAATATSFQNGINSLSNKFDEYREAIEKKYQKKKEENNGNTSGSGNEFNVQGP